MERMETVVWKLVINQSDLVSQNIKTISEIQKWQHVREQANLRDGYE